MSKMSVDEIHKLAYAEYERTGQVTLSGEVARELFTNIPNREKQLEAALEAARQRTERLSADLAAVVAYARKLEDALIPTLPHDAIEPDGYVVHAGTDDEVRQDLRAEAGVQRIMEASDGSDL